MRIKQAHQIAAEQPERLPYPLNLGPSVQIYAPAHWAAYGGTEPPDQRTAVEAQLAARRAYNDYFTEWMHDQGLEWDEARHYRVCRRPYW